MFGVNVFKMATDSSGLESQWQRGRFHFFKYYRRPRVR